VFSVQWAQGICEISILATLTVIRFKAKRPRMLNAELRTLNDSSDARTFDLPIKCDVLVLNMLPIRYLLQINKLGSKSDHLGCARQILP
jgi:hypothetical protein